MQLLQRFRVDVLLGQKFIYGAKEFSGPFLGMPQTHCLLLGLSGVHNESKRLEFL